MSFKEYITENYNDKDHSLIQAKKEQKNLEYVGWNTYENTKGDHFKWDSQKKDFVQVEKKDIEGMRSEHWKNLKKDDYKGYEEKADEIRRELTGISSKISQISNKHKSFKEVEDLIDKARKILFDYRD